MKRIVVGAMGGIFVIVALTGWMTKNCAPRPIWVIILFGLLVAFGVLTFEKTRKG